MIVNLIVILTILFLGAFYANGESKYVNSPASRKSYIRTVCVILVLQSGLRNVAVGDDTYAYYLGFESVKLASWSQIFLDIERYYVLGIGKDPGYAVFQKIVQYLFPDFQLFLLLVAVLFFIALGNFVLKNTAKLSDAVFAFVVYCCLFYWFYSITGIRQTIATAAVLYSYEFVKARRLLVFVTIILLASTIHLSCLIFAPFYWVARVKNIKAFLISIIVLFPLLLISKNYLIRYLGELGPYKDYGIEEGAGTLTFTIMMILVAGFAIWRMRVTMRANRSIKPFYIAFALAVFFTPLTWVNPNAMRVVQYFSIFMLGLLPSLLRSFQNESRQLQDMIYAAAIVVLIALSIKSAWGSEYGFFWQEMALPKRYLDLG